MDDARLAGSDPAAAMIDCRTGGERSPEAAARPASPLRLSSGMREVLGAPVVPERFPLPMLELELKVGLERALRLPPFPGSLLRGVFGAALRRLACVTGRPACDGCPVAVACAYPALFEPLPRDLSRVGLPRLQEGLPPPFLLRLTTLRELEADRLTFGMSLFGDAARAAPLILAAWREALAAGLGRGRVPGQLLSVTDARTGKPIGPETDPFAPALARSAARLELRFPAPLRLSAGGQPVRPGQLSPRMLVAAIVRRARLMALHGGLEVQAIVRDWPVGDWLSEADRVRHRPQLGWSDLWRKSSRQGQWMNLGGLVGRWHWEEVSPSLQALLSLAELLHVGKEASFGLGAIKVRPRGAGRGLPARGIAVDRRLWRSR